MMNQNGFAAAIRAAPGDDTVRLIFADWLEDHSDPRDGCLRLAARLRASYGPHTPDHSRSFWQTLCQGLDPAWWVEEARRLADIVQEDVGDGSKTAVLIALALCQATLLFPPGWDGSDSLALHRAAGPAFEAINRLVVRPRSSEEVGRSLRTAALGDVVISEVFLSAIPDAGRDGLICVQSAPPGQLREKARMIVQQGLRWPLSSLRENPGGELQDVAVLVSLRPLQAEEVRRALIAAREIAGSLLCLSPWLDIEGQELIRKAGNEAARVILSAVQGGQGRDCFEDLAAATGAYLIGPENESPVELTPARLGRAGSARVEAGQLLINHPAGPPGGDSGWVAHLRQEPRSALLLSRRQQSV
jgi:uncharacterized protein (TIGR02996 family)